MPIRVRCQCGQKLKAPDAFAGRHVRCPVCKTKVPIPAPSADPEAPAPPLPPDSNPAPAPIPTPEVAVGPSPIPVDSHRPGGPPTEPAVPGPPAPESGATAPDRGTPEEPPLLAPGEDEGDPPPPIPAPTGPAWGPEPDDPVLWEWPDELPGPPRSAAEAPAPHPGPGALPGPDDDPAPGPSPGPAGVEADPDAPPGRGPRRVPDEPEPGPEAGAGAEEPAGTGPESWSEPEAAFPFWDDEEGSGPMPWDPARSDEEIEADRLGDRFAKGPPGDGVPGEAEGDPDRTERAIPPFGPELPPTEASRSAALGPELPPTEEGRPAFPEPDLSETQASRPAFPAPGSDPASTGERRPASRAPERGTEPEPEPEPTEEAWPAFPAPDRPTAGGPGPGPSGPTPEPSTVAEGGPGGVPPVEPERPTLAELFPEPEPGSGAGAVPEAGSSLMEPFIPSTWDEAPPPSPSQSVPWQTGRPGEVAEAVPVDVPPVAVDLMDSTSWGHAAHVPGPPGGNPSAITKSQHIEKEQVTANLPPPRAPTRPVRPGLVRQAAPGSGRRGRRRILGGVVLGLVVVLLGAAVVLGLPRVREGLAGFLAGARAPRPIPPAPAGPGPGTSRAESVAPSPAVAPPPGPELGPTRFDSPPQPRPVPGAELIGLNLVLNPDFEQWMPRDGPPAGVAEFPGWDRLGSVAVRAFEEAPVDLVSALDPPDLGRSYALGGLPDSRSDPRTMLRQAVDLSPLAPRIDLGAVRFDASAWLGGVDQTGSFAPNDSATLTLRFLDGSLDELPGTAVPVGPIDDGLLQAPSARPGVPRMARVFRSGPIPAGTRAVSFELAFDRRAGTLIDATADGLRVVLEADP
ncbi:hypothetical protein [Tautonia plasticadhaerens]|uniref:Uncharacterized protein n=1 Tax=Tautonia plasticadhaerens TaxID=2527974 RepID=A0A518HDG9_9BACT|nr:hypothetical protein [Tautonia plasticadhaerens]QDV38905.1 hypothetical protein ElP_68650 [Tautonia plasticadhaerens]